MLLTVIARPEEQEDLAEASACEFYAAERGVRERQTVEVDRLVQLDKAWDTIHRIE